MVPRHAVGASPSALNWTACADGFFRSASLRDPTCRACVVGGTCALGWRRVACTPDADAHCERCGTPPLGHSFAVAGDCNRTTCSDGWWALTPGECAPCPVGMVCRQDAPAVACPGNCTTAAPGAWTPLLCVAQDAYVGVRLQWDVFFLSPIPSLNGDAARAVDAVFLAWVIYGAHERCELIAQSDSAATLACTLAAPACIADLYSAWAVATVPVDDVAAALQQQLQPSLVVMGPLAATIGAPLLANASASAIHGKHSVYILERRRWGQAHLETLETLGLCVAILLGMSCGVSMACALACTRLHRRRMMCGAFWRQRGAALLRLIVRR